MGPRKDENHRTHNNHKHWAKTIEEGPKEWRAENVINHYLATTMVQKIAKEKLFFKHMMWIVYCIVKFLYKISR